MEMVLVMIAVKKPSKSISLEWRVENKINQTCIKGEAELTMVAEALWVEKSSVLLEG
jgi:hypothetical protein